MGKGGIGPAAAAAATAAAGGFLGAVRSSAEFVSSIQGTLPQQIEGQVREGTIAARYNDYDIGQFSRQLRTVNGSLGEFKDSLTKTTQGMGMAMAEIIKFTEMSMRGLGSQFNNSTAVTRSMYSASSTITNANMLGMNLSAYGQSMDAMRSSGLVGTYGRSAGYGQSELAFNRDFSRNVGVGNYGTQRDMALQNIASSSAQQVSVGAKNVDVNQIMETQTAIFRASMGIGTTRAPDASFVSFGNAAIQRVDMQRIAGANALQPNAMAMAMYDQNKGSLIKQTDASIQAERERIEKDKNAVAGESSFDKIERELRVEGAQDRIKKLEETRNIYMQPSGPASLARAQRAGGADFRRTEVVSAMKAFAGDEDIFADNDNNEFYRTVAARSLGMSTVDFDAALREAQAAPKAREDQEAAQKRLADKSFTSLGNVGYDIGAESRFTDDQRKQLQATLSPIVATADIKDFNAGMTNFAKTTEIVSGETKTRLGSSLEAIQKDTTISDEDKRKRQLEAVNKSLESSSGVHPDRAATNALTSSAITTGELTRQYEILGGQITNLVSATGNWSLNLQGIMKDILRTFEYFSKNSGELTRQMEEAAKKGGPSPTTAAAGPAAAFGGNVYGGLSYTIGERGPEGFIPKQDGYVVPNKEWKGPGRAFGGPVFGGFSYEVGEKGPEGYAKGKVSDGFQYLKGGLTPDQLNAMILERSAHYKVDPRIALAVLSQESTFDPNAISKKGAVGLFQVMPSDNSVLEGTEKADMDRMFVNRPTTAQLKDPATNIDAGIKILAQVIKDANENPSTNGKDKLTEALYRYNGAWHKVNNRSIYDPGSKRENETADWAARIKEMAIGQGVVWDAPGIINALPEYVRSRSGSEYAALGNKVQPYVTSEGGQRTPAPRGGGNILSGFLSSGTESGDQTDYSYSLSLLEKMNDPSRRGNAFGGQTINNSQSFSDILSQTTIKKQQFASVPGGSISDTPPVANTDSTAGLGRMFSDDVYAKYWNQGKPTNLITNEHGDVHNGTAHRGVDFAAPLGTPVFASSSGYARVYEMKTINGVQQEVEVEAGSTGLGRDLTGYGHYVKIFTEDGKQVQTYGHLGATSEDVWKSLGQRMSNGSYQIKRGTQIGAVGSTGNSTGPHLHFEVTTTEGRNNLDPFALLPHFAAGGAVAKGKTIVVGEKGPEAFVPDSNGTIVSNAALNSSISSFSGNSSLPKLVIEFVSPSGQLIGETEIKFGELIDKHVVVNPSKNWMVRA